MLYQLSYTHHVNGAATRGTPCQISETNTTCSARVLVTTPSAAAPERPESGQGAIRGR